MAAESNAGRAQAKKPASSLPRCGEWTLKKVQGLKPEQYEASLGGDKTGFDPRFKAYFGDLSDGKPHGSGIAVMHEGSRFGGEWTVGQRDGRGVYDGSDGTQYDGEWRQDQFHGKGKRTYQDGTVYIGEWREGKRHGQGTMSSAGFKYEGNWEADLPSGPCRFRGQSNAMGGILPFGKGNKDAETVMKWFFGDKFGGGVKDFEGTLDRTQGRVGKGKTEYRNGDCYTGEYEANKRHGKGRMSYDNGDRFDGEWRSDLREGQGIVIFASGGRYEGQWLQDMKHGHGIREYHNGDRYVGGWEKDEISGHGKMHYRNEDEYSGEWRNGKRHGQGEFRFRKQSCVYNGPLVNGLFHTSEKVGLGRMQYYTKDGGLGDLFVGSFVKGERTRGIMWQAEGSILSGEWRNDKLHGRGLMWFSNGDFFYGNWARETLQGVGCMRYADGSEYGGEWEKGKRHGKGTLQRVDGTIVHGNWEDDSPTVHYDGEWRDGVFAGVGKYVYRNGSVYFGLWVDGHKHISGSMKYIDGGEYKGGWCEDAPGGAGTMSYPNGAVFSGDWREGRRHGPGVLREKGGAVWRGRWEEDERHGDGVLWSIDPESPPGPDRPDLACTQARWDKGRMTGSVLTHYTNGRTVQTEYYLGAERSAVLPVNQSPGELPNTCKTCGQAFGMTRRRYNCPGCHYYFCSGCTKSCDGHVSQGRAFAPFEPLPVGGEGGLPSGERLMDGRACT
eukprot:Hpha_TRINITY_DN16951_c2_g1::TRINITY_DN16951_c2_g1_i1::g.55202::m.55202